MHTPRLFNGFKGLKGLLMSENSQRVEADTVKDHACCRWLEKILTQSVAELLRHAEQLQAGRSSQAPVLSQAAEAWTEEGTEVRYWTTVMRHRTRPSIADTRSR